MTKMTAEEIDILLTALFVNNLKLLDQKTEENCPFSCDFSDDQRAILATLVAAAITTHPHIFMHLIIIAYEAGKEFAEVMMLEKMTASKN